MMKFLVVAALLAVACAKHEQYTGWKSFYVGVSTNAQAKALEPLIEKYELDFLSHPTINREGLALVKPEYQTAFIQEAETAGIAYRIHSDDVKSALDYDDQLIEEHKRSTMTRNGGRQLPYDNYQELEVVAKEICGHLSHVINLAISAGVYSDILKVNPLFKEEDRKLMQHYRPISLIDDYLDYIGEQYPDVATVVSPANSFEGRPIKYVKISTTNFEDESKPVIFIDGGIHAREWISPPTVTWAIHKLVEDLTESDLLERFDWILLPVVNPDGYKFSHTNNRLWRKTRSTNSNPASLICPGVDGNRNFDFVWNTIGTSNNPCSNIYAGSSAFSEIETRVVRDILHEHLARTALYLTIHSFGSMILYPWGHDGSLSQNALGLHTVGVAMVNAIQSKALPNFPNYVVGNSALVIGYYIAGSSEDYAHYIGVPLSYTYELPGFSSTGNGFHLAPEHIDQVVRETWEGIVVGARRAGDLFTNV